jgi:hypothetical protein
MVRTLTGSPITTADDVSTMMNDHQKGPALAKTSLERDTHVNRL